MATVCERSQEVQLALAKNANTSGEGLQVLAQFAADRATLAAIVAHPNLPDSAWREFASPRKSNLNERYLALVESERTPDYIFAGLCITAEVAVRRLAAAGTHTPGPYLARMTKDQDLSVVLAAAENPNMPIEGLEQLVECGSHEVRKTVWWHRNATRSLLDTVAVDPRNHCSDFREAVRMHRDASHGLKALVETGAAWERKQPFGSEVEFQFWEAHVAAAIDELRGLVAQYQVGRYRLDFAIPKRRVGVEIDGLAYHSSQSRFVGDRQRERHLEQQGWRIVRFAASEVMADASRCVYEAAAWIRSI